MAKNMCQWILVEICGRNNNINNKFIDETTAWQIQVQIHLKVVATSLQSSFCLYCVSRYMFMYRHVESMCLHNAFDATPAAHKPYTRIGGTTGRDHLLVCVDLVLMVVLVFGLKNIAFQNSLASVARVASRSLGCDPSGNWLQAQNVADKQPGKRPLKTFGFCHSP
jgi:hypothetical protein